MLKTVAVAGDLHLICRQLSIKTLHHQQCSGVHLALHSQLHDKKLVTWQRQWHALECAMENAPTTSTAMADVCTPAQVQRSPSHGPSSHSLLGNIIHGAKLGMTRHEVALTASVTAAENVCSEPGQHGNTQRRAATFEVTV